MRSIEEIQKDLAAAIAARDETAGNPLRAQALEQHRALTSAAAVAPSDTVARRLASADQLLAAFAKDERAAQLPVSALEVELYEARGHHEPAYFRASLATLQEQYEAASATQHADKVRPIRDALVAAKRDLHFSMARGAEPCERCGRNPSALRHVRGNFRNELVDGRTRTVAYFRHAFEIGCVNCGNKRAVAETPEATSGPALEHYAAAAIAEAVKRWNDENYLPPK